LISGLFSLVEHDSDYEWSTSQVIAVSESYERLEAYKAEKEAWLAIERAFKDELYDVANQCRKEEPSYDISDSDEFMYQLTLWAHNILKPAYLEIYAKYGKEFPVEWDWINETHIRRLHNMRYEITQNEIILV